MSSRSSESPDHGRSGGSLRLGERVRVTTEPQHAGKEGVVVELRTWGQFPVGVNLDGDDCTRAFHASELKPITCGCGGETGCHLCGGHAG